MKLAVVLLSATVAACTAPKGANPEPKTEEEKTLYAVGVRLQMDIKGMALSPAELDLVIAGMRAAAEGKVEATLYDERAEAIETFGRSRLVKYGEINAKAGEAYREKAAREPGAVRTKSGLIYIPIKEGSGKSPDETEAVMLSYQGRLIDGHVFEATRHGTTLPVLVGTAIPCWAEGLQLMKGGGRAKLVCPPALAYGAGTWGRDVKPQSTLVYEMDVLQVLPK
jgi:FKBP-type peptidyl-prolyl cis-trans isomerase